MRLARAKCNLLIHLCLLLCVFLLWLVLLTAICIILYYSLLFREVRRLYERYALIGNYQ